MTARECQHCTSPLHPKARYCSRCGRPAPPGAPPVVKAPRTALQVIARTIVGMFAIVMLSGTLVAIVTNCNQDTLRSRHLQAENALLRNRMASGASMPQGVSSRSVVAPREGWSDPVDVPPGSRWSIQTSGTVHLRKDGGGEPIVIDPRKPGTNLGLARTLQFQSAEPHEVPVTVTFSRQP